MALRKAAIGLSGAVAGAIAASQTLDVPGTDAATERAPDPRALELALPLTKDEVHEGATLIFGPDHAAVDGTVLRPAFSDDEASSSEDGDWVRPRKDEADGQMVALLPDATSHEEWVALRRVSEFFAEDPEVQESVMRRFREAYTASTNEDAAAVVAAAERFGPTHMDDEDNEATSSASASPQSGLFHQEDEEAPLDDPNPIKIDLDMLFMQPMRAAWDAAAAAMDKVRSRVNKFFTSQGSSSAEAAAAATAAAELDHANIPPHLSMNDFLLKALGLTATVVVLCVLKRHSPHLVNTVVAALRR